MVEQGKSTEAKNNVMGQRRWVWTLFGFVVIQVVLANSLVAHGREINELADERSRLLAEIVSVENEIARASSLAVIRREAEALGLGPGAVEFLPPPPLAAAP